MISDPADTSAVEDVALAGVAPLPAIEVHNIAINRLKAAAEEGVEANFRRYLGFLGHREGQWLELQALDAKPLAPFKGEGYAHASTPDAAVKLVREADEFGAQGVYIIPNLIDSRITARSSANEWHGQTKGGGTKDHEVIARRALYIDCDANRPRGISATKEERKAALARAVVIYREFATLLGSESALGLGMSGNGGQVHVALDDP